MATKKSEPKFKAVRASSSEYVPARTRVVLKPGDAVRARSFGFGEHHPEIIRLAERAETAVDAPMETARHLVIDGAAPQWPLFDLRCHGATSSQHEGATGEGGLKRFFAASWGHPRSVFRRVMGPPGVSDLE